MIWQVMLPLEYQVRLQARLRVNKKASKQTNRERESAQMRKSQTEMEHKPTVKVRISNIFGYREVIAIADLPVIYVMYKSVCVCVCTVCRVCLSLDNYYRLSKCPKKKKQKEGPLRCAIGVI